MSQKRKGLIDGVPSSFNTNFVVNSNKKCQFCDKAFNNKDLDENSIVYTDEFDFVHKTCIIEEGFIYTHTKPADLSSPVSDNIKMIKK